MKKFLPDLVHLLAIAAFLFCLAIGSSISVHAQSRIHTQQQLEVAMANLWQKKETLPATPAVRAKTGLFTQDSINP